MDVSDLLTHINESILLDTWPNCKNVLHSLTKALATRAWRRHEQQWLTSAGTVDGDVGSLRQCCPQLFQIFAKDVAPSRAMWFNIGYVIWRVNWH